MDELRKNLVERVGLAEDRAEAAIHEMLTYLVEHLPEPAAHLVAEFAERPDEPQDPDRDKKVTTAAMDTPFGRFAVLEDPWGAAFEVMQSNG